MYIRDSTYTLEHNADSLLTFSLCVSYKLQVLSFQCGMDFTHCEACSHKTPVISAHQARKSEVHITISRFTQMLLWK